MFFASISYNITKLQKSAHFNASVNIMQVLLT